MERSEEAELVLEFSPALVAVLLAAERAKGIRVPMSLAEAMAGQCGYPDLDPERCWEKWRAVRAELVDRP